MTHEAIHSPQAAAADAAETSLLDRVIAETPHVNMRDIWLGKDQTYKTFDGRVCTYSTKMLAAVLGGDFANANPSEQAAFLAFCITNRLDPVRRHVYFIRYLPAEPPSFVVSWEVFLERAQRHPQFDGYECGIVWKLSDGTGSYHVERGQPCDYVVDATHEIIGSWAVAYRKDRSHHAPVEVPLSEMMMKNRHGEPTRSYARMPTTMYTKVATARALRRGFPEDLAGLYTESESETLQAAIRETERLQSGSVAPPKDLDELAALLNRGGTAQADEPVPADGTTPTDEPPAEDMKAAFDLNNLRIQILDMYGQNKIAGAEILKKHGFTKQKELKTCHDTTLLTAVHAELYEITAPQRSTPTATTLGG